MLNSASASDSPFLHSASVSRRQPLQQKQATPIPIDQLGAVAGKQYHGDGLSVTATADGARLRCVFQRLEGQVTPEGLWLTSATERPPATRFRVVAVAAGASLGNCQPSTLNPQLCPAPAP